MKRRELMQFMGAALAVGASLPGLSFADQSDPLRACAERFAAARKKHALLAGWESAPQGGFSRQLAKVSGKWPIALRGRLYRNGPGNFERGGQRYLHWFDGDGLIQCWDFRDGSVHHQAQFVQTPKLVREQKSNRFEVMAAGTTIPNARAISGPDDVNTANISVLHLAGKSYALWEAGSAFEFDRDTLDTKEIKTWRDDLEGVAFSAHPVYERDGSVWNVGHLGKQLIVYHVSATGELLAAQLLKLPREGYMHSFTASESKLIFVLAPLVPVREAGSFFERLDWRAELGSQMLIVDKNALDKPQFVDFEAGAAYHYADAWDEANGDVALRACWNSYEAGNRAVVSPLQHYMQATMKPSHELAPTLVTLRVNSKTNQVALEASDWNDIEFPIQTRLMRQSELLLLQGRNDSSGLLKRLLHIGRKSEKLSIYDGVDHIAMEEHLYVPQSGKRYAIGTALNIRDARSGLLAFDLARLSDGPIAQAWLPYAVPLGFHSSYLPS